MDSSNIDIKQVKQYLQWEPHEQFRSEVQSFLDNNDQQALDERFGKRIAFGTAGLRSKMGGGYAYMNDLIVLQTTQGLLRYAEEKIENAKSKGVMIQYDGRYNSLRFAQLAAAVFQSQGWKVYWFKVMGATPLVPFGVLKLNCACGIMVTASHNPKEYNGYKVYWDNGAQIIPPHDQGIQASIMTNLKPWQEFIFKESDCVECSDSITKAYFEACKNKLCWQPENNQSSKVKIAYTAMHGIGGVYMAKAFESFNLKPFYKVEKQFEPDPEFSTVKFPNPEEGASALTLACETAKANGCQLIFANDPDADRLAVAEVLPNGEWHVMNGNEIAALLADHVWLHHKRFNPDAKPESFFMVASTVSSKYLQRMAEVEGFKFEDTLTGWKWMGNVASDRIKEGKTFLFGYEVEIGFGVGDISFDKDGLRTAVVFAEMADRLYREGKTCVQRLRELYAKYGYFEMCTSYFYYKDAEVLSNIFKPLRGEGSPENFIKSMGEYKVSSIRDVTTGYDSSQPDKKSKLPIQASSQMITFYFENGATATMRNSGTEPKLKYYLECRDLKNEEGARILKEKMNASLIKHFIQPEKFGLIARNAGTKRKAEKPADGDASRGKKQRTTED